MTGGMPLELGSHRGVYWLGGVVFPSLTCARSLGAAGWGPGSGASLR